MKKLNKIKLDDFQEMNDSEMRQVVGGYEGSGGDGSGGCCAKWDGGHVTCGLTRSEAEGAVSSGSLGTTARWCCDSCGSASWMP